MSKRFTDTDVWTKPWFMDLTPEEKSAWFYIKDACDNVGVWTINKKLAEVMIGCEIDWDVLIKKCNGNIEILSPSKLWLIDFCDFQYGELREECRPHQSYIRLLKKHEIKGYVKGIGSNKDKEKEKEKEKEKDKRGKSVHENTGLPMNLTRYTRLCNEYTKQTVDTYMRKVSAWADSKGEVVKDGAASAENFILRDVDSGKFKKDSIDPQTFGVTE